MTRAFRRLGAEVAPDGGPGARRVRGPDRPSRRRRLRARRASGSRRRASTRRSGRPSTDGARLLGLCLGFQLLFEESEEFGTTPGLGLLRGRIVPFRRRRPDPARRLERARRREGRTGSSRGVPSGTYVYFVHSFRPEGVDPADVAASCDYGGPSRGRHPVRERLGVPVPPREVVRRGAEAPPELPRSGGRVSADRLALWPAIDLMGGARRPSAPGRPREDDGLRRATRSRSPGASRARGPTGSTSWTSTRPSAGGRTGRRSPRSSRRRPIPVQVGGGLRDRAGRRGFFEGRGSTGSSSGACRSATRRSSSLLRRFSSVPVRRGARLQGRAPDDPRLDEDAGAGDAGGRRARALAALGVTALLVTDVARDGAMTGPNLDLLASVRAVFPGEILASGGMRGEEDLAPVDAALAGGAARGDLRPRPARRRRRRVARLAAARAVARGREDAMTLAVRVIPCLDVAGGARREGDCGSTNLRDAGDPVEAARPVRGRGGGRAAASSTSPRRTRSAGRSSRSSRRVAEVLSIPFTVGGGVRSVEDADALLAAGPTA